MTPKLSKPLSSERFRPSALSFWTNKEAQASGAQSSSSSSTGKHKVAGRVGTAGSPVLLQHTPTSPKVPLIVGLDEEVEEQDRQSMEQRMDRAEEAGSKLTGPFPTRKSVQLEDSSDPPEPSPRESSTWNSQTEWAKHESFVHPLDILPTGEEGDLGIDVDEELYDEGEDEGGKGWNADSPSTEEARERARRRRRQLLELKRRKGRRKIGAYTDSADQETSFTWNSSSSEGEASDEMANADSQYESGGLRAPLHSSLPTSPSQSSSASMQSLTPNMGSDTFYDVNPDSSFSASDSSLSTAAVGEGEDEDVFPEHESSWLHLSPRPQNTTASSATLRQDAMDRQHDLHHQGSSSTLLGISSASTPSKTAKKRTTLPPPRPKPTSPLPPPPSKTSEEEGERTFDQDQKASTSSSPASASALPDSTASASTHLGRNGTVSGRPRGATVGAVPGSKVEYKQRMRPRSTLCNEVGSEGDLLHLLQSAASSSSSSLPGSPAESDRRNGKRSSSTGYISASALADGDNPSRSSMTMARTPSTSANSSSVGIGSSIMLSSEGGSRSRSGSNTSLLQQVQYRPKSHASFVIAVVGHRGAGKSTVIKKGLRQFGLSKPNVLSEKITSHSTVCIVDHEQRTIEVLEMDASVLLNGPSKRFAWPKFLPYIDAVILCYDAAQISSFRGMSELLENFALNHLSTVMLACKSEINPKAVDPYYASDMAAVYNVGLAECSVQSEEGKKRMRDCFSFLVKEVAKSRAAAAKGIAPFSPNIQAQPSQQVEGVPLDLQETLVSQDSPVSAPTDTRWRQNTDRKMSDATTMSGDGNGEEGSALQESIQKAQMGLQSAKSAGGYVSIDELWDKLFYAAVSGNDERFLLMFMVFYRGFVQPIDLLKQVISRFNALSRGERTDSVMIRYSLMRLTTMLGDWMQEYPGDLSGPETYPLLCDFFQRLLQHPSTVHVASPMQPLLEAIRDAPDVDAVWSKDQDSDKPRSVAADVPPVKPAGLESMTASSTSDEGARSRSQSTSSVSQEAFVSVPRMLLPVEGRHRSASDVTNSSDAMSGHSASGSSLAVSSTSATTPSSQTGTPAIGSSAGFAPPPSHATATGNEQKLILRNVSNLLFDIRDDVIAQELTRMEWDLFSAVGSRDLLRHILVSRAVRSKDSPVARSIAHFNYISSWVCSMILVQSKTKQRARLLEKFMDIAGILRKTNNYNTLHAVLAGLGNASVHRLKNTRELLNGKPVIKTYQSLARLMGNDRSFAAYRLALENSEGRTIPYLGVHLQDILSMSDGNPSKRASDGMVHWKKFNLMDEAVMAIIKCQQYQEPLRENPSISRLIFDLPVMDDDVSARGQGQEPASDIVSPHADPLPAVAPGRAPPVEPRCWLGWFAHHQAVLPCGSMNVSITTELAYFFVPPCSLALTVRKAQGGVVCRTSDAASLRG